MSIIVLDSVSFYYPDSEDALIENLNLNLESSWKLGLVGRNGRGKTTLLKLISRVLKPVSGTLKCELETSIFPFKPGNSNLSVIEVIKESVAPYSFWEKRMEELLSASDEKGIAEFGEIQEKYASANGYKIDSIVKKELHLLGMEEEIAERRFSSLSNGEQTRALIISLFLRKDSFALIDEPTDNLDMNGREALGEYLSGKNGFILATHDRELLDKCVDHILSLNKSDVSLTAGNYAQWKHNTDIELEFERRKNENLKKEIKSLETSAKRSRGWSVNKEKEKIGAFDKGFISHKSAKLMKRALAIEKRIESKISEKKMLLANREYKHLLKLESEGKSPERILSVQNVTIILEGKVVVQNVSFEVNRGERVALLGCNGSGKSTVLRAINKEIIVAEGSIFFPAHLKICNSRQSPSWTSGYISDYLQSEKIDETRFRQIMGAMGAWGEIFERPLETFSKGQLKKVELCKSFLNPCDLIIWDEPLNYLDIESREQIEELILSYQPTILFTEHDSMFVENIATKIVNLDKYQQR